MKKTFVLTALALAASFAHAGITGTVTAVSPDTITPNTFTYLATPPAKVGNNNINTNDTVFAFAEKQSLVFDTAPALDIGGHIDGDTVVSSYFVYFDPKISQRIHATLTFSETILGVYTSKGKLMSSEAIFGLPSVDYKYASNTGLELQDRSASNFSFSGKTMTLNWKASSPGDHIRVLTAPVPEPETYAMLLAGLGLMGAVARRRKAKSV